MRRFMLRHKFWLYVTLYVLIFFVPILFSGGESLDAALLVGLE